MVATKLTDFIRQNFEDLTYWLPCRTQCKMQKLCVITKFCKFRLLQLIFILKMQKGQHKLAFSSIYLLRNQDRAWIHYHLKQEVTIICSNGGSGAKKNDRIWSQSWDNFSNIWKDSPNFTLQPSPAFTHTIIMNYLKILKSIIDCHKVK